MPEPRRSECRAGNRSRPVLAVVGATAVGKTRAAIALAEALGGEIVSLDSRQMYRGVTIGTAKPSRAELERVPHHLVDVADPDRTLTLSDVQTLARAAVASIHARGNLPILAGGTGQYVWSLLEGWRIPRVPPDRSLRTRLERVAERFGAGLLHARLARIDPTSAERIHPHNIRRVVRALEVFEHTGMPMSVAQSKQGSDWPFRIIGLRMDRSALYARIDRRLDAMLEAGLEREVRGLVSRGIGFDLPAMQSVGYREWRGQLEARANRDEVVRLIRAGTRRLVRQQELWFKPDDERIEWFDLADDGPSADELARLIRTVAKT